MSSCWKSRRTFVARQLRWGFWISDVGRYLNSVQFDFCAIMLSCWKSRIFVARQRRWGFQISDCGCDLNSVQYDFCAIMSSFWKSRRTFVARQHRWGFWGEPYERWTYGNWQGCQSLGQCGILLSCHNEKSLHLKDVNNSWTRDEFESLRKPLKSARRDGFCIIGGLIHSASLHRQWTLGNQHL